MSQDYQARVFADKVIKKALQDEIEKLALVALGNYQLTFHYSEQGFDPYPYCKNTSGHIGTKKMHYRGTWREWGVLGHTKTDVYLEVLRCLANENSIYYPIVSDAKIMTNYQRQV